MKRGLIYFIVTGVAFCGCKKKEENDTPTACFQTSSSHYHKMENIHFNNCSSNFEKAEWYFGDGGQSKYSEAEYRYASAGIYTVRLKTINGVNSSETSKSIWIADTMRVNYTMSWDSTITKSGDMVVLRLYYKKEGESTFNPTFSDPQYNFSGNIIFQSTSINANQSGFVNVPDPSSSFQLKIVAACYTFTGNTTLPDHLAAKDSIVTSVFDGFNGPAVPNLNSKVSIGRLKQQYSMSHR